MFGAPSEEQGSSTGQPGGGNAVARGGQASAGGRTWTFNVPGGGQGRVMFGGFNGQMGAFGPMGGDQAGGLDSCASVRLDKVRSDGLSDSFRALQLPLEDLGDKEWEAQSVL